MTSITAQCGRTYVHSAHETTEGGCPGLPPLDPTLGPPLVIRMPRRKHGEPEVLNPEVLGGRGVLVIPHDATWEHIEQPIASTFAEAEPDPYRTWMIQDRLARVTSVSEDDDSGVRVTLDRDPWASDGAGYDVRVLRAGLQVIASDAAAREDYHTAAYAHSVLAGEPIPPTPPEDPDPLGDGTDPEAVEALLDAAARWGQAGVIRVARALFHADAWHTTDPDPDEVPEPTRPAKDYAPTVPDPTDEPCGAAAYGVRFAACDLPNGHTIQHHAWYDAGHGPTTILWGES